VQKLEYRDKKDREQVFWRSWESDNLCFAGDKKKRFRSRFAFLLLGIERNESLGKRRGGTNNHHRHRARELRFLVGLRWRARHWRIVSRPLKRLWIAQFCTIFLGFFLLDLFGGGD